MHISTLPRRSATHRQEVLDHVARYRMTTLAAVHRLPALQNRGRKTIRRLLDTLCQDGQLEWASLYGKRYYYYLTNPAAAVSQRRPAHDRRNQGCGPLSDQAKIHNYAILLFCCLSGTCRQRLTAAELARHFPGLERPGLPLNYYVDMSRPQPTLGLLRVDTGGRGRWDRVLAKCQSDLLEHATDEGFQPFLRTNQFEITLVTTLPQKAQRLGKSIETWRDTHKTIVHIVAMPELLNLIAPPPVGAYR